jgi:hypothetical protein
MSIESRNFDLGLVESALEREAPKKSSALRRLAAAFVATSLSALAVPGCTTSDTAATGPTLGLDNGTVGCVLTDIDELDAA